MTFQMKDRWDIPVTVVADDFIDHYMAAANGEYVKVYLYILRHRGEALSQEMIADALNHTESDVRRALAYWEKAGVLSREENPAAEAVSTEVQATVPAAAPAAVPGVVPAAVQAAVPAAVPAAARPASLTAADREPERSGFTVPVAVSGLTGEQVLTYEGNRHREMGGLAEHRAAGLNAKTAAAAAPVQESAAAREPGPVYSAEQVNRLSGDEEFAQLLYIAQKYMNKVFTPRDCQVFAYLYDGLKFSPELLEYLVEYCVQNGHVSIRYMETVAINWHKQGFKTPEEAKEYTEAFNSETFSVMKAFGLGDRRPGTSEQQTIRRWFKDYGFDREIVLMACNRTIAAIHNPSFQYADKILSEWKQAGVRTKADVEALDEKRGKSRSQGGVADQSPHKYSPSQDGARRKSNNQFHNFKQRDTDYDALVLKQLKERVGQHQ